MTENSTSDFAELPDNDSNEGGGISRLSSSSNTVQDKDTELRKLREENKSLTDEVKECKILLTTYR